ncbi:MAG TPA: ABC transporter permease [Polyangiaceae bacterium]|nr:ABC transporter permease [Polyangiaceae bacterium]
MFEGLREVWSVLGRHRLRTFATALSVAWGMFMLTILLGAGRGLENGVEYEFRDQAVNTLWLSSGQVSLPYQGHGVGRDVRFNDGDYRALLARVPGIAELSGIFYLWGEFQVRVGPRASAFDIRGVQPGFREVQRTRVVRGRYLNERDLSERRKVAVIGSGVREVLFGERDPVGQRIEIRGVSFLVVGEFEDDGGEGQQRKMFIPLSTTQSLYGEPGRVHNFTLLVDGLDMERSRHTADAARQVLVERHGVAPNDGRAVRVINDLEAYVRMTAVFDWIRVFVWVVGLGTLFSGLVGVGNITLIGVAERTREFGVRKSLGATPASIVGMVLTEAVVLTTFAGYVGLVAGVGLVEWVSGLGESLPFFREPRVDLAVAAGAGACLLLAGVVAGLFPALRAAHVDPIVALREGA